MHVALEHKHYAVKFFLAWVAFATADALWLDELSGWLKLATHALLLLAALLSVVFWAYRIWRLHRGDLRSNREQE